MSLILMTAIAFLVVGIGIFLLYNSVSMISNREVTMRVRDLAAENTEELGTDNRDHRFIETRDLAGSLLSRVLVPSVRRVGEYIGRFTPSSSIEKASRDLGIAGYHSKFGAREYYGIRVILLVVALALDAWLLSGGFDRARLGASVIILVVMILLPISWLRNLVNKRQNAIRKGFPDALDMLSVCATAGLGFDQALQRVSDEWQTPISEEFGRMLSEMELGFSRQEALRNMESRLQISELSSFISVILQSEQLGMSIADTLQAQAEQMRIDRKFKAQEIAQKMPAKMLFPLAFLILPAILAVLLGPSVPVFIDLFFNVLR